MSTTCNFCLFFGRLLLGTVFLQAGIEKFMDFEGTSAYMASKGFTFIPFFLVVAALVEIVGGLSLLFGYHIRLGAAMLFLFLIPVSILFHNFWDMAPGFERQDTLYQFMKNLGIMGGLLYVIGTGAGKWSIDRCCCKSCPTNTTNA